MTVDLERRIRHGAANLGIPQAEYRARVEAGERRCVGCHAWHPTAAFGARASFADGVDNVCRASRNARCRAAMRRLYARRKAEIGGAA